MQTNLQAPEKRDLSDGQELDVHSIFYTIQGEGPFSGTPAVFIRLAGCNLQCPLCDTEYTEGRQQRSIASILNEVMEISTGYARRLVVITGGEPFRQEVTPLIQLLLSLDWLVQIETNGTLPVPPFLIPRIETVLSIRKGAYIVVSPKGSKVHKTVERLACAYKYVITTAQVDPDDGLPMRVLGHQCYTRVARPPEGMTPIYIQPADLQNDLRNENNMTECIRSCIRFGYSLQLQVHKLLKVP